CQQPNDNMEEKFEIATNGKEGRLLKDDNMGVKNDNIGKKEERLSGNSDLKDKFEIVTSVKEKTLLWKIDLRLIPLFTLIYTICFLDRVNIGNAKLANLESDLNLTGSEYNWIISIFFVGYALCGVPSNIIIAKFSPSFWRIFEADLFPGIIFYITKWYKRSEQSYRTSVFTSGCVIAGAFSGFTAFYVMGLDGTFGLSGWQWTARWLTDDERKMVINRIQIDSGQISITNQDNSQIFEAFKDW
ncbi:26806_t:CDS:2, partial [Racocetra persica]